MSDAPIPPEVVPAWQRLFAQNLPLGQSVYHEVFDDGWLFPLQRKAEMGKMMDMARTIKPRVVMEIGADKGGSFFHWLNLPTVDTGIAIEMRGVPWADTFRRAFPKHRLLCLEGSSYASETVAKVNAFLRDLREPIDCLFIDGDKDAFDKDFAAYLPSVRQGGLVFMHDINMPDPNFPPRKVFDSMESRFPIERIIDTSESDEVERRMNEGLRAQTSHEGWTRIWLRYSAGVGVVRV